MPILAPARARPPLGPVKVDRGHPLVKCLDHLWLPDALQPIDKISGLINTGGGASRLLGVDGMGRCMNGSTGGGTFTIPAKDAYPLVIVALGTMNINNGWGIAEFQGSGSYVLVQTNSSGIFQVKLRRAFGTEQVLSSAAAIPVGTPICVIVQVFSATDYRAYVNGELLTGTTSFAGAGAWLSSAGSFASSINGRVNLIGIGSGRGAISDALALRITRNPQAELWKVFAPRNGLMDAPASGIALDAAGSASAIGSASLTTSLALAASGVAVTSASTASLTSAGDTALAASGASIASGSASLTTAISAIASGVSSTVGAAALLTSVRFAAAGASIASGGATLLTSIPLVASGLAEALGTANLASPSALAAIGVSVASGSASLTTSMLLAASGVSIAVGVATFTAPSAAWAGVGSAAPIGSAALLTAIQMAALGAATASGFASLTAGAAEVAERFPLEGLEQEWPLAGQIQSRPLAGLGF